MRTKCINIFCLFIFSLQSVFSQQVTWISSTENNQWVTQKGIQLVLVKENQKFDLSIIPICKQQTIDGWGGCFNELGWDALMVLSAEDRNAVLKSIFDPVKGLKFNICRLPIGANDYSHKWHSLNETPGDFEMKNFSIDCDKSTLIPYIQAALKIRPDLQLWA